VKQPIKIFAIGGNPAPMSPSEFDSFARKEIATNAEIVKTSGISKN
jgi:tripartite-type tricarboxylate transporter receptor subunit TctC